MLSDLNKNKEIFDLLSKNLTKKDFKKVMDFIYAISVNSDFHYTQQLYQKLLHTYYETDDKKQNIVKLKLVKGGQDDEK
tara:strand:- start:176 stop:412 length:237 start_codon:yes stop_codon:yes gene_type:complete